MYIPTSYGSFFTISLKNMADFFSIQQYCYVELLFKFFDKMVNKGIFLEIKLYIF